jgi:hypothetical protein
MTTLARLAGLAALALTATGCASVPANGPERPPGDTCRQADGQRFVGQRASAETASAILAATGATRLRWVPPRTAVTMEYAYGRATVSYDDNYAITTVSCS